MNRNNKPLSIKGLSSPRNVVGDLPLTGRCKIKRFFPYVTNNTNKEDSRQKLSGMTTLFNSTAFTLIELLVVVLIIGILAAVAVPQYQKAVDQSRYMQVMILGRKIAQAQQQYKLANGTYSGRFDELGIDMPTPTSTRQDAPTVEYYFYKWGYCWTHSTYDACALKLNETEAAWYFQHRSDYAPQCWAEPTTSKRANALCQTLTKKTSTDGHYSF